MEEWNTIERPGYLGRHRNEKKIEWNERYGNGNWRIAWIIGKTYVDSAGVYALYEDGYFHFLQNNRQVLNQLIREAADVYDDELSNVNSRFDYFIQETQRTHLQDIAIRRSLIRMGLWFQGNQLIQIRHTVGTHPLSMILSPGKIPFHRKNLIYQPELIGWWDPGTIESFYHSNKFLQIKNGPEGI